jgi:hypothetical protein
MDEKLEVRAKVGFVLSQSINKPVQTLAFDSFADGWGAAILADGKPFIAIYEDGVLDIQPATPEIPADEVVEPKADTAPKPQPL